MIVRSVQEFGAQVKARRIELNYSQKYVSEVTGLSASFISNLENGKETAELGKALLLAKVLGMDMKLTKRGL